MVWCQLGVAVFLRQGNRSLEDIVGLSVNCRGLRLILIFLIDSLATPAKFAYRSLEVAILEMRENGGELHIALPSALFLSLSPLSSLLVSGELMRGKQ